MRNSSSYFFGRTCIVIAILLSSPAMAQERMKQLIVRAIEMQGEPVQAELQGEIADYIKRHTGSLERVQMKAQLIQALLPEGCGRVQIDFMQQGLQTMQFPMQMNYCIDGSVPVIGSQQ